MKQKGKSDGDLWGERGYDNPSPFIGKRWLADFCCFSFFLTCLLVMENNLKPLMLTNYERKNKLFTYYLKWNFSF